MYIVTIEYPLTGTKKYEFPYNPFTDASPYVKNVLGSAVEAGYPVTIQKIEEEN